MHPLPKQVILATSLLCLIAPTHAEESFETSEVVVTEKAAPASAPFARNAFIEREEIDETHAPDGNALLYGQPGLKLSQNKPGATSGISLKGASGGVGLVTFDGIPLFGNFAGTFSLQSYALNAVENIRIAAPLGEQARNSRTLGGSIELHSRRMQNGTGALRIEAGSHQWLDTGVAAGIGSSLGDITLAAGWNETFDGASQVAPPNGKEGDDHRIGHALVNVGKTFGRGDVFASLYYANNRTDMDGPALKSGRSVWADDPNGWVTEDALVAQVRGRVDITDRWESSLQVGGTHNKQDGLIGTLPAFLGGRRSMALDSRLWLVNWSNRHALPVGILPLDAATFSWGVEVQDQQAESGTKSADDRLFSPSMGLSADVKQWSFYSKIRQDQTRYAGDKVLYSLGTEWHLSPDSRLWANQGSNFRTAGVNERLHPLFGNSTLKPEASHGWDGGIEHHFSADTSAQLGLYRQHYHNLIITKVTSATVASRAGNLADVEVTGLDVNLRHAWSASWNTQINYGYMDADDRESGKSVPARPRNKLSLVNAWRLNDALKAQLDLTMHDGFWFDSSHLTRASSVVKLNGSLDYALNSTSSVYVRAENLTDDDTSEIYALGAPGRAFYIGLSSQW